MKSCPSSGDLVGIQFSSRMFKTITFHPHAVGFDGVVLRAPPPVISGKEDNGLGILIILEFLKDLFWGIGRVIHVKIFTVAKPHIAGKWHCITRLENGSLSADFPQLVVGM